MKLIKESDVEKDVGRLGVNYNFITPEELNIKSRLLKDNIAQSFTDISATLVYKVDDLMTLNLTIAGAKNSETNQNGISVSANFDNIVTLDNNIDKILDYDYITLLDQKLQLIF